ncbi:adhesion G-protein coupled receptor F1-like [Lampris incognitus]|uniref:adhesion G-protein coupled receptor F1-like n=1 Tax=Lampris incognitus TaxID=2546036 RepID=UPI0024B55561|nr:adhesion G-protein coupled receptor F1-like [Lampris incognitus]
MNFIQSGTLNKDIIRKAPNVRVKSKLNIPSNPTTDCIEYDHKVQSCTGQAEEKLVFTCRVTDPSDFQRTTTLTIFRESVTCQSDLYGSGRVNDISNPGCAAGEMGNKTAICQENGAWRLLEDTCIVTEIRDLLTESQNLVSEGVLEFVVSLSEVVQTEGLQSEITNSTATISAIVDILENVADVSASVNETVMLNVLQIVDVLISDETIGSWEQLNVNETQNASSALLGSLESLTDKLDGEFDLLTSRILLNRTTFNNVFTADLNSSVAINIQDPNTENLFITTIVFASLDNILPPRDTSFDISSFNATSNETIYNNTINAPVLLVKINKTIDNVILRFDKSNNSLTLNPQCIFWNFRLFDNLGGWDNEGCEFVSDEDNIVTCSCNHLTSFSILMSTSIPESVKEFLRIITFIGVGISMGSLVICLIIEGIIWKTMTRNSTSFMRHVSIVNIAVCLLIANIWFIVGAAITENPTANYKGSCSAATFFVHFFYLALFFWMLGSGLLLFYRTVLVFSHMSKAIMLAIGFTLGYGAPLIIAVVTVASTAPGNGYIREEACWLNWDETKALLAFVIPALAIVFINFIILVVVVFKMLRRGVGDASQPDEKHALMVIARCLAILTPFFGLTWALGVGTMADPTNEGIHIAFAFFNSLQGFFILVFGTLLDAKIRAALARKPPIPSTGSHQTRSTSAGISSSSGFLRIFRRNRDMYRVMEAANTSSSGATESFISI